MANQINAAIVFASSRSQGNTRTAIQNVLNELDDQLTIFDLNTIKVSEYDYHFNQEDDFHKLMQSLLQYDTLILATPIHWYSVSAKMKCFIDRLSDLLNINKEMGRLLRGKKLAIIASYNTHPEGYGGFETPLCNTANYLGMQYLGVYYHYSGENKLGKAYSSQSFEVFMKNLKKLG